MIEVTYLVQKLAMIPTSLVRQTSMNCVAATVITKRANTVVMIFPTENFVFGFASLLALGAVCYLMGKEVESESGWMILIQAILEKVFMPMNDPMNLRGFCHCKK
jgi:hypothetical protein